MHQHLAFFLLFLLLSLSSCDKKDNLEPAPPAFELIFQNDWAALDARVAVFLSDEQGALRAFRWLPAADSAHLAVPGAQHGDRFDCTVATITTLLAPGSGVRDTTVALRTFSRLQSGKSIRLAPPAARQSTDLYLFLSQLNTLDSILVPDGLTFARPQPSNNFEGAYRVSHSGQFWLRVLADGDPVWRYRLFENISDPEFDAAIDVSALPPLGPPQHLNLPFAAPWQYQIDRVIDTAQGRFLPIGDLVRAPGGATPFFDQLDVYEPPNLPWNAGYRLRFSGADPNVQGIGYACDRFFDSWPSALPAIQFEALPLGLSGKRQASMHCTGSFDLLTLIFTRSGTPQLHWEVLLEPAASVIYRLPDLPADLGNLFPALQNYDFNAPARVRAEAYQQLQGFEAVLDRYRLAADPLWPMKAGYLAKERVF
ncbi:MAG: hypothetical protein IT260_20145 [Saprospiraceae bacterium]|nr:hypothetical protein [Saprospiraceae bacterium]